MCRTKQMLHESIENNKSYEYQEREPNDSDDFLQFEDDDVWER